VRGKSHEAEETLKERGGVLGDLLGVTRGGEKECKDREVNRHRIERKRGEQRN